MSKQQTQSSKRQSSSAEQEAKTKLGETFYTRDEIRASHAAFGVRPEVLAGALSLLEGEKLTRSQVADAIEKFKKRKV